MNVPVTFYSYFKELAGTAQTQVEAPEDATVEKLLSLIHQRFPKLEPMKRSTLIAVGLEYQPHTYQLRPGDQISLFPPVQGG